MAQCACAMKYISTANNFNQFKNLLPLRVQTVYQLDRCCAGRSINYLVLAVFPHYQQTDFKSVLTVTAILHIVLASKRQQASAFYKCQNRIHFCVNVNMNITRIISASKFPVVYFLIVYMILLYQNLPTIMIIICYLSSCSFVILSNKYCSIREWPFIMLDSSNVCMCVCV